jgi:hypothetical protein
MEKYLETKKKLEDDGWNFTYIFDIVYIHENKDFYAKRLEKFEERYGKNEPKELGNFLRCSNVNKRENEDVTGMKIIHIGSRDGFARGDIILIEEEKTNDRNLDKSKRFIEAFKKIVSDKTLIPDQTVILLNNEKHHLSKAGVRGKANQESLVVSGKKKKLEQVSKVSQILIILIQFVFTNINICYKHQAKGQTYLPNYFKSVKASTSTQASTFKKEEKEPVAQLKRPEYKVEDITMKLRGDKVKILRFPKTHYELDASQFIAVYLLNEIAARIDKVTGGNFELDIKRECAHEINIFPDTLWTELVDYAKVCEDHYRSSSDTKSPKSEVEEDNDEMENTEQ